MLGFQFGEYEALAAGADAAFGRMSSRYHTCVSCAPGCSDCCHAVFGLFLVEAAYLRFQFEKLDRKERRQILSRAGKAEKELERVLTEAKKGNNPDGSFALEKVRIRCPMLNEADACVMYPFRPITCRVYGIPTAFQGKARVCWKARFEEGKKYPAFNLDEVNRKLYRLSREYLQAAGGSDSSKAGLLVSVSKVLSGSTPDLIREVFL
jgi:Fe-S-cluster containining protein